MKKRGVDLDRLKSVMMTIAREERLDSRYRPHRLKGKYQGAWECHLKHDWLLIWRPRPDHDPEAVVFVRTGTHDDLFG